MNELAQLNPVAQVAAIVGIVIVAVAWLYLVFTNL